MTDEQLTQDCALPGGYTSGAYSAGWTRILDRLAAAGRAGPPACAQDRAAGPGSPTLSPVIPGPGADPTRWCCCGTRPPGRDFDDQTRERIFREHLAYTLSLVTGGDQLAAGPVDDSPAEEDICGIGIFQKESLDEVRRLIDQDPGVQQGLYCFDVMTWRTAPGTVASAS